MYYVYVLYSLKSKRLYIGSSKDLRRRLEEHNQGSGGEFTNKNRPYKLIFYEAFFSKKDSLLQEKFYKSGYGRQVLKEKIKNSLDIISGVI